MGRGIEEDVELTSGVTGLKNEVIFEQPDSEGFLRLPMVTRTSGCCERSGRRLRLFIEIGVLVVTREKPKEPKWLHPN